MEQELRNETKKWLQRIEKERLTVGPQGKKGEEALRNIDAYVKDSMHFLEKGDLVRSFEAVIWAWSWIEIGLELEILKKV